MGYLKEVNIKYDMPTADLAVRRATYAIENGRTLGASAVKLIHGYGSSGKGGKIRVEVRAYLERQKARGKIRDYIPGERFSIFDETRLRPLRRPPPRPRPRKCQQRRDDSRAVTQQNR